MEEGKACVNVKEWPVQAYLFGARGNSKSPGGFCLTLALFGSPPSIRCRILNWLYSFWTTQLRRSLVTSRSKKNRLPPFSGGSSRAVEAALLPPLLLPLALVGASRRSLRKGKPVDPAACPLRMRIIYQCSRDQSRYHTT